MKTAFFSLFLLALTACVPPASKAEAAELEPTTSTTGVVTLYSATGEVIHQWYGVDRVRTTESGISFDLIGDDNVRYFIGGTYSVTPAP